MVRRSQRAVPYRAVRVRRPLPPRRHHLSSEPHSLLLIVGIAFIALLATLVMWSIVGHSSTVAHERGHGLIWCLVATEVKSVKLNRDQSALTTVGGAGFLVASSSTLPAIFARPVAGFGVA
jgi:hypothetical protein